MEIEVDKVCRICLKDSEQLEPIFGFQFEGVPIVEIIKRVCYEIKLLPKRTEKYLPSNLCLDCVEILCSAARLNQTCIASEHQLKELLLISSDSFVKVESCEELKHEIEIEILHDPENFSELKDEETADEIEIEKSLEESSEEDVEHEKPKRKKVLKKHPCPICLKLFEKPSKVARHEKTHDVNKKPFACEEPGCFQRFLTDASLKRHAILHSGMTMKLFEDKTYECVVCNKVFRVQEALASHMRTHKDDDNLEFSCNLCDKVFKKLNELTRHSRKHPENKSHKCLICSKMFSKGSHLIDHLNRHNNLRPHVCHVCNKAFQQSSTLKDHLRTHTSEKPFLCSECGKSFNNPSNLRQHVKRHLNLKEFACHLCPGKFSCKASLESHLRSHSGLKPHACNICQSSFTKGSSLKKHIRTIHEGIKPFECEACSMKFNSSEHLKRHFRTHTGEKPYKCDFEGCDRAYAQSNDLLKHKKIHIGDLVYKCQLCSDAFRLQSQLRDHYKVHYSNDETTENKIE